MRKILAAALIAACASTAQATTYNDSVNDVNVQGNYWGFLDIVKTEVTNDATDLSFKITVNGDTSGGDWGKYIILINDRPGGDTDNPQGNPSAWDRKWTMAAGADHFIGSWLDWGGGAQQFDYDGTAAWSAQANPTLTNTPGAQSMIEIKTSLASLGLSPTKVMCFDIGVTGGNQGDGAIEALGNPAVNTNDWGIHSFTSGNQCYTVVPEPLTLGFLAFGAATALRRRVR